MKKGDREFKALFGIKPAEVKENCILMPMIPKGALSRFGIKELSKGRLYHAASSDSLTLIHCGIGAGFTGDAVLYLKQTCCKNLFLFGSCGLVRRTDYLRIASLVSPFKCFSFESFSEMLLHKDIRPNIFYPDKNLYEKFLNFAEPDVVRKATCATLSSLKLEQQMPEVFKKNIIEVVDMECSAFFCAASHCNIKAIALFYVSDIINNKPFYEGLNPYLKSQISLSVKFSQDLLCKFIEKNLTA